MSLLDEIRGDLLNESASLTNTLRKAKVLASAIAVPEFREWVDSELGGYNGNHEVPNYRLFGATNLGHLSGMFQSEAKNVPLPTLNLPEPVKEFAENMTFREGVGELEALCSEGESYQIRWPPEYVMLAREHVKYTGGFVLFDAHQPVPNHVVCGILDQVKNKLLDFILSLQENNITSENLADQSVEPEVVRNLFNINIYGDRNIVAGGENVVQSANPVITGDIESLLVHLRALGIGDEELAELQEAVLSEPRASNGQVGPRVGEWIGRIASKAASGALNVGVEKALHVAMEALAAYYGH